MLFKTKKQATEQETGQLAELTSLISDIANRQLSYQDRTDDILAKLLSKLDQDQETMSTDSELTPTRDISLASHMTDQVDQDQLDQDKLLAMAKKYNRLDSRLVGALTTDGQFVCVYETQTGKLKYKLYNPNTDKFSPWIKLDSVELTINIIDQVDQVDQDQLDGPMSNITKQAPTDQEPNDPLMANLPNAETLRPSPQALMANLPNGLTAKQVDTTPRAMVNCRAIKPTCKMAVGLNNVTGVKWPLTLQVYACLSHDKRSNLPLDNCVQSIKDALKIAFKLAKFDRSYYVQREGDHIYVCLDFPYVRKGKNNNYIGSVYEHVNKQIELINYPSGDIPQTI